MVDRPAALGDVLVADLQELDVSGLPIIGRRQEDRTFLIGGPNATSHDLDNQLVGVSAGEERHVRLVHAEDHTNPGLAEQEVRFQVTAKEVRERNLPELDDEFAKDIGDFESLDGLKTRIRDDLQAGPTTPPEGAWMKTSSTPSSDRTTSKSPTAWWKTT